MNEISAETTFVAIDPIIVVSAGINVVIVVVIVVVNFVASNDMFWGEKNQTNLSRFLSPYRNVVNVGVVNVVNIIVDIDFLSLELWAKKIHVRSNPTSFKLEFFLSQRPENFFVTPIEAKFSLKSPDFKAFLLASNKFVFSIITPGKSYFSTYES